jgi:uncharacterized repeat protein (TIGR03803 family)
MLYTFTNGTDGANPVGDLVRDSAGNLYGTAKLGGKGYGVVFKVGAAGGETTLYSFAGGNDGAGPAAGLIRDSSGNLYTPRLSALAPPKESCSRSLNLLPSVRREQSGFLQTPVSKANARGLTKTVAPVRFRRGCFSVPRIPRTFDDEILIYTAISGKRLVVRFRNNEPGAS